MCGLGGLLTSGGSLAKKAAFGLVGSQLIGGDKKKEGTSTKGRLMPAPAVDTSIQTQKSGL